MKLLLTALSICLLLPAPAFAKIVGAVIAIEGSATVRPAMASSKHDLKPNDTIEEGDIIQTAEGSKMMIFMTDGTEIILGEDAYFKVEEYNFAPKKPEDNKGRFDILRGTFLYTSGLLGKNVKKPDIEITNGFGTIGIRGTVLWGGSLEKENEYGVFVQDGHITYKGYWGERELKTTEGIFVSENKILRDVKPWGQPMIEKAVATITMKDAEKIKATTKALKNQLKSLRKKK